MFPLRLISSGTKKKKKEYTIGIISLCFYKNSTRIYGSHNAQRKRQEDRRTFARATGKNFRVHFAEYGEKKVHRKQREQLEELCHEIPLGHSYHKRARARQHAFGIEVEASTRREYD